MLKEKLQTDMKEAMIARDEAKLLPIRMLISEIKNFEISKGGADYSASDEEILGVIEKQIKQRKESAEEYKKGDRDDLAVKEENEIEILSTYLPEQMSEIEVDSLIEEAMNQTGASTMADMGKVMGILTPKVKGRTDMGILSGKIKERLGG